jgi:carbon storage regulator
MLVLSRKLNESIVIDGNIEITVVSIRGNQVRLGFNAPDSVGILREELCCKPIVEAGLKPPAPAAAPPVASFPRFAGRV